MKTKKSKAEGSRRRTDVALHVLAILGLVGLIGSLQSLGATARAATSEKITYTSCAGDSDCDIWVMASDGTGKRRVIDLPAPQIEPAFSPDGKTIAFVSGHDQTEAGIAIWTVNENGTGLRRLSSGADDHEPAFSPDGQLIAFSRLFNGQSHIWTMTPTGGSKRQLTTDSASHVQPTWSSDGRSILYSSDRGPGTDIYRMYLNASRTGVSGVGRLTSVGNNVAPDYLGCRSESSPRQKVIFSSDRSGNFELYEMGPTGSSIRRVSNHPAADGQPTWAPQGGIGNDVAAFVSDRNGDGSRAIFVRRWTRYGYVDTNISGSGRTFDLFPDFWGSDVCSPRPTTS